MQRTPDPLQSPQASASTNSAIRACDSVVDGISQETAAESRGGDVSCSDSQIVEFIERTHQRTGELIRRAVYATCPTFEAPRDHRHLQKWTACRGCARWYAARAKDLNAGKGAFCSNRCCADHAARTGKFAGAKNPRWLGGVSTDNMRYRRRAIERWPEHEAARKKLNYAVRAGHVAKLPCEVCGSLKSNGHHEDYGKPLVVIWLCRPCHDAEHARLKQREVESPEPAPIATEWSWRGKARPL